MGSLGGTASRDGGGVSLPGRGVDPARRFSANDHDSLDFIGLPIPAGAGSIAMLVLTSPTPVTHPAFIPVVVAFVLGLSLLMVSNLPYPSFKGVNLPQEMAGTDPLSYRPGLFAHHADASRPVGSGRHLHSLGTGHGPDPQDAPQTGRSRRADFNPGDATSAVENTDS